MAFDFNWEQSAFTFLEEKWKTWKQKRNAYTDPDTFISFKETEHNLLFVARSLCQKPVMIKESSDVGGVHGNEFIVPKEMTLWNDSNLNRRAWLFRIWYMSEIWRRAIFLSGKEKELQCFIQSSLSIRECLGNFQETNPESYQELSKLIQVELQFNMLQNDVTDNPLKDLQIWSVFGGKTPWDDFTFTSSIPTYKEILKVLNDYKLKKSDLNFPLYFQLFGRLMTQGKDINFPDTEKDESDDAINSYSDGTEREAPAMDDVEAAKVSKKDQEDAVLFHTFEKVECLDDYNGMARDFDGDDEMDDHHEAMQELQLRQVIRSEEQTHSIYRADIRMQSIVGDLEENLPPGGIPYPEWDGKKRRYKQDWCRVYPKILESDKDQEYTKEISNRYHKTIHRLKRQMESIKNAPKYVNRQRDGDMIDMDVIVDNHCMIKAQHTPSERVYLKKQNKERDLAIHILIDISLSADSYVDGKQILEICKESLVVIGKSIEMLGIPVEVSGFYSQTRKECSFLYVKKFHEPWDLFYQRISELSATGYTRIGPALRHATHRINSLRSRKKLILLLSDGKPNDYDKYEGIYGIQDTRQAVRETLKKGILLHALAISNVAYDYLPTMLGKGKFSVVKQTEDLVTAFENLYQKLM